MSTVRVPRSAAVLFIGMVTVTGRAAHPWEKNTDGAAFRVDSGLVLVPITVTDHRGAAVTDLTKQDFTILDDQRVQAISAFYSEDAPCSVGLVVDVSGSVRQRAASEDEAASHTGIVVGLK